jgi:quercetin dioxygenase-like cupin family protein
MAVVDVHKAALDFVTEIADTQERKKKALFDSEELQGFLLYIKANGHVPSHEAKGDITVQTLIGNVRMGAGGTDHQMPVGSLLPISANVPHELWAEENSVCLVTMSKAQ